MAERKVVLLMIDERFEFFGSPASMFYKYSKERLGISQQSLNNYFSKIPQGEPLVYKNRVCTIIKAPIFVKPTTRGRKKQVTG